MILKISFVARVKMFVCVNVTPGIAYAIIKYSKVLHRFCKLKSNVSLVKNTLKIWQLILL